MLLVILCETEANSSAIYRMEQSITLFMIVIVPLLSGGGSLHHFFCSLNQECGML